MPRARSDSETFWSHLETVGRVLLVILVVLVLLSMARWLLIWMTGTSLVWAELRLLRLDLAAERARHVGVAAGVATRGTSPVATSV